MHFRALSELIGSIYDTVVDPSACPTMLNGLADLLGVTGGAQVGAYNSKAHSVAMLAPRVDPKELPRFSQYWANVWRQCDKHPIGAVVVPEMRISDPDHCRADIFNGSSMPHGPERMMGGTLLTEGSVSTVVSVSRPYPEGEFDAAQTQLFAALLPHLQRAVQLRIRLAALRAADKLGRDAKSAASRRAAGRCGRAGDLRQPSRREDARRWQWPIPGSRRPKSRNNRGHAPAAANHRRLHGAGKRAWGRGRPLPAFTPGPRAVDNARYTAPDPGHLDRHPRSNGDPVYHRSGASCGAPQRTVQPRSWADPGRSRIRGRDIERRWAASHRQPSRGLVDNGTDTPCSCVRQDRHAAPSRACSTDPARPAGNRRRLNAAARTRDRSPVAGGRCRDQRRSSDLLLYRGPCQASA